MCSSDLFSELKRMSTQSLANPTVAANKEAPRPRAISTNESNRRQFQEERQRLLLEKAGGGRSRASSPAPGPRTSGGGAPAGGSHRRDRSVGRFPVAAHGTVTSPTETKDRGRMSMGPILGVKRASLEVPGEPPMMTPTTDSVNGGSDSTATDSPNSTRSRSETIKSTDSSLVEKRNSLGRSNRQSMGLGRRIPVNPTPAADPVAADEHRGVTLEDKPMDD